MYLCLMVTPCKKCDGRSAKQNKHVQVLYCNMYLDSKWSHIISSYHLCLFPTNIPIARSTFQTWNPKVRKVGPQRRWDSLTIFPKSGLSWSTHVEIRKHCVILANLDADFDSRIANNQPVISLFSRSIWGTSSWGLYHAQSIQQGNPHHKAYTCHFVKRLAAEFWGILWNALHETHILQSDKVSSQYTLDSEKGATCYTKQLWSMQPWNQRNCMIERKVWVQYLFAEGNYDKNTESSWVSEYRI